MCGGGRGASCEELLALPLRALAASTDAVSTTCAEPLILSNGKDLMTMVCRGGNTTINGAADAEDSFDFCAPSCPVCGWTAPKAGMPEASLIP